MYYFSFSIIRIFNSFSKVIFNNATFLSILLLLHNKKLFSFLKIKGYFEPFIVKIIRE